MHYEATGIVAWIKGVNEKQVTIVLRQTNCIWTVRQKERLVLKFTHNIVPSGTSLNFNINFHSGVAYPIAMQLTSNDIQIWKVIQIPLITLFLKFFDSHALQFGCCLVIYSPLHYRPCLTYGPDRHGSYVMLSSSDTVLPATMLSSMQNYPTSNAELPKRQWKQLVSPFVTNYWEQLLL